MCGKKLKTIDEVKRDFERRGISAANWARAHDIRPGVIYEIFSNRSACKRGEAHRAAVLLGIKDGVVEQAGGAA